MTTQLQSDLTAVLALLDAIICASESVSPTPHPDCSALVKLVDVEDVFSIRDTLRRHADALRGCVLVPVEPTDAMMDAWNMTGPSFEDAYREMIAVAKEEFGACKACEDEAPGMMCLEHLGRELDKQSHVHDLTAIRQFRLK